MRFPRCICHCLPLVLATLSVVDASPPTVWSAGHLFIAGGDGSYRMFDRQGNVQGHLSDEKGGYTTDCGFHPTRDQLYTTNFTRSQLVVFQESGPAPVQVIDAGQVSPGGHSNSLVFNAEGDVYVGHPDGNALVHKYSAEGFLMATFDVDVERRGANWVDLAADQNTLFYTSQGRLVLRYDVGRDRQLDDFSRLPGIGVAQSLRLLPPGDGSGGLLVADGIDVKRLNGDGQVVQTYDMPGHDAFFAINLDPDGRSFWAADSETDDLFRFEIDTGALRGVLRAGAGNTVFGVCLRGEPMAAIGGTLGALPGGFRLAQNHPNPFNPSTQIRYQLPEDGTVSLVVYDILGQPVRTLIHGFQAAGSHAAVWDGRDASGRPAATGLYIYRLSGVDFTQSRRMLLIK